MLRSGRPLLNNSGPRPAFSQQKTSREFWQRWRIGAAFSSRRGQVYLLLANSRAPRVSFSTAWPICGADVARRSRAIISGIAPEVRKNGLWCDLVFGDFGSATSRTSDGRWAAGSGRRTEDLRGGRLAARPHFPAGSWSGNNRNGGGSVRVPGLGKDRWLSTPSANHARCSDFAAADLLWSSGCPTRE
jgi:hypothetical protein